MIIMRNLFGIVILFGILYLLSNNKTLLNKKLILKAFVIQLGFANVSSMGICVSGISVFCPDKRGQLSKLAFRGMIGGFCVSILSALIVGLIIAI